MDQKLAPHLQKQLEVNMAKLLSRQNMDLHVNLVTDCFGACVHKFPSKILDKEETSCIENCADRFIKLSQRVAQKYQEHQAGVVQQEKLKKEQALANR